VLDYPWELYDLRNDWTQAHDVASENPGKLKEMQKLFWKEAEKYRCCRSTRRSRATHHAKTEPVADATCLPGPGR